MIEHAIQRAVTEALQAQLDTFRDQLRLQQRPTSAVPHHDVQGLFRDANATTTITRMRQWQASGARVSKHGRTWFIHREDLDAILCGTWDDA